MSSVKLLGFILLCFLSWDGIGQTLHKVVLEPCSTAPGTEYPNEILSMTNGANSFEIGDLAIHSINPNTGPQPNVTFSWTSTGTDNGGNPDPNDFCPGQNMSCLRWLDHADPADGPTITSLVNQLNAQSGVCSPVTFIAPTGPNLGTIPPGARMIVFLGAGGNASGTPGPGFDGLGTNMDFSSYCNTPSIYAVFGINMNPFQLGGLLGNGGQRAIRIQVSGTTVDSVYVPANPGGALPDVVDSVGVISNGGPCTPPDLFGFTVLDAGNEVLRRKDSSQELAFSVYPNPACEVVTVTFPFSGPETIQQKFYSIDGKSTEIRTFMLDEGKTELEIRLDDLPPALYTLELFSSRGVFRQTILRK